jgi:spore germination protein GerM
MKIHRNLKFLIFALIFIGIVVGLGMTLNKNFQQNYFISVYFVKMIDKEKSQLIPVKRYILPKSDSVNIAVTELLKGPTKNEQKKGFFTEIPSNTKLIEIKETPDEIYINLSHDFELNGGSASMITRLNQLEQTLHNIVKDKPVYLELNGKKTEYIGGEGIEVPRPLFKN